jgi:hypothetical protein
LVNGFAEGTVQIVRDLGTDDLAAASGSCPFSAAEHKPANTTFDLDYHS